jgi:hypothetical protein
MSSKKTTPARSRAERPAAKSPSKPVGSTTRGPAEETEQELNAEFTISPLIHGAVIFDALKQDFFGAERTDFGEVIVQLRKSCEKVRDGDFTGVQAMLITQATALQAMFASSVSRSRNGTSQRDSEVAMDFALRAQAQSRAALQTLVELEDARRSRPGFVTSRGDRK